MHSTHFDERVRNHTYRCQRPNTRVLAHETENAWGVNAMERRRAAFDRRKSRKSTQVLNVSWPWKGYSKVVHWQKGILQIDLPSALSTPLSQAEEGEQKAKRSDEDRGQDQYEDGDEDANKERESACGVTTMAKKHRDPNSKHLPLHSSYLGDSEFTQLWIESKVSYKF